MWLTLTLASIWEIRIPLVAAGAIAEVALAVNRVQALAVVALARVGARVAPGLLAHLRPDRPVQHQRHSSAAVARQEVVRGDEGRPELERLCLHQHRVAAAGEVVDL